MIMDIEKLAKKHEAVFTDWQDGREAEIAFYGGASQLERFAEAYHQAKCNEEIQTLRAKVEVLVEALREITYSHDGYARKKAEQAKVIDTVIHIIREMINTSPTTSLTSETNTEVGE